MYPRYPRVFLYMFNDLLPTPPPNLCENGLGVSLSCTCVAFSPFAKLNRFFPKKSTTNRKGTASKSSEKLTERVPLAAMTDRRGAKRKQERTDRGKVLKSRMLGVQSAQLEEDSNCDQSVQRPGVRTMAMCWHQAEVEANLLGTQDTAGDSEPRGIG